MDSHQKRQLRAIKSRVIVEDLWQPFPSGLHLSFHVYKSGRARIVAVGPESDKSLAVGQKILTKPLSGIELRFDGKKYRVLEQEDVLGVISATA